MTSVATSPVITIPTRSLGKRRPIALGILLSLVLAGGSTYAIYRRDMRTAKSAALSGSAVIPTACGSIEYAERGSGPPVLSIHGTGGGWDQGLFIARGLSERGFRVIAPSRNGYLRTPMPGNPSPQNEAKMLACLLDALNIDRASVIAASAGATPALQLGLRYPKRVSSLVLLVPAVGGILPPDTADLVSPVIMNVVLKSDFPYWAAMKVWPKAMLTIVATPSSLVPRLDDRSRRDMDEAIRMILPVTRRRKGILYDANNQKSERPYPLERMTVPTLLISAADDLYGTLANARAAASAIPGAQLIEFASGGHLLLGRDAEMWPRVADFMRFGKDGRGSNSAVTSKP